jgi:hypothetical protein
MENKGQQGLSLTGSQSLREELDQFTMETFEIEDLASLDQDAPVTPIVCSTSDCVYCCSCISVPPISIIT